jgi:peptidyl-prolyl isomerase D
VEDPEVALRIVGEVRAIANARFKEGDLAQALQKYQSECPVLAISLLSSDQFYRKESIRYLDVHPVMPDNSPPALKASFDALYAPLLLNSALAAVRVQPPSPKIAVDSCTRALTNFELTNAEKGVFPRSHLLVEPD